MTIGTFVGRSLSSLSSGNSLSLIDRLIVGSEKLPDVVLTGRLDGTSRYGMVDVVSVSTVSPLSVTVAVEETGSDGSTICSALLYPRCLNVLPIRYAVKWVTLERRLRQPLILKIFVPWSSRIDSM